MHPGRVVCRTAGLVAALMAAPLILGGCFAMQKDLDPIRSDISVLEKQFMELQREQARLRVRMDEPGGVPAAGGAPYGSMERIRALESRLDRLEVRGTASATAGMAPELSPMAPEPVMVEPEPVMVEPIQEPGAQPPVLVTPGVAPTMPPRAPMAAEDIYKDAMTSFQAGDYQSSEEGFRRILEEYPDDRLADNAAYRVGEIQFGRGEYAKAIESFRRVINDYPIGDKAPDAVYMMGRSYEELGQADKAREAYNRVMDNYPYSDAARNARQRMDGNN